MRNADTAHVGTFIFNLRSCPKAINHIGSAEKQQLQSVDGGMTKWPSLENVGKAMFCSAAAPTTALHRKDSLLVTAEPKPLGGRDVLLGWNADACGACPEDEEGRIDLSLPNPELW